MVDEENMGKSGLHSGHVIANHILVSFHVAFVSSLLNIPADLYGPQVLKFVFMSYETIISACFWFLCFHSGVAIHEIGHYRKAVKLNALQESLLPGAKQNLNSGVFKRLWWYFRMFVTIPYGKFNGVKKEGLTYYPDAPFNLCVAAAGPQISGWLALIMLPLAGIMLVIGLMFHLDIAVYIGRPFLGLGAVGLLDFFLADPGKRREFKAREAQAAQHAQKIKTSKDSWESTVTSLKKKMVATRMHEITLVNGEKLRAPWQFRNCGMGGRHTEKEYPESNISFQELMFVPLCSKDYEEAQMITVRLQTRLKEIIEKEEGARVMGIGLEGGLAPFVTKRGKDIVPEQRVWDMAIQAIRDCGYKPGEDIVIAFDHAASELSTAYRKEFKQTDAVGMYYFWRSEEKVAMSREQMLELFKKSIVTVPAVSFEDAFSEDDFEGWRLLMSELGDKMFIIGDDLVTTNDAVIEKCADDELINTALIKANQIGTLSETILAMLVALGKGLELVVSHRSKSPNDDMEAQIAMAANALGLKTGGGANTERLFKYGAVTKIMKDVANATTQGIDVFKPAQKHHWLDELIITDIIAYEEPTNAGIPTVGVEVFVGLPDDPQQRKVMKFTGATPLGTSAGMAEAIHLVDSIIEKCPTVEKYPELFAEQEDMTFTFKTSVKEEMVVEKNNEELRELWFKAHRYSGKGCKNAVDNVLNVIAPEFVGKKAAEFTNIMEIDKKLLDLELTTAVKRGKIRNTACEDELVELVQRKANLGMNAILSVSLALARMIAHLSGKDLWQLLREQMKETIARTVSRVLPEDILKDMVTEEIYREYSHGSDAGTQVLKEKCTLEELIRYLIKTEEYLKQNKRKLHTAIREEFPVYNVAITV
jgi:enolase